MNILELSVKLEPDDGVVENRYSVEQLNRLADRNMFHIDLADYIDDELMELVHTYSIMPKEIVHRNAELYIQIFVYFNRDISIDVDKQVELILKYLSGQISDGWGANGIKIDENSKLEFASPPEIIMDARVLDRKFEDAVDDHDRHLKESRQTDLDDEYINRLIEDGITRLNEAMDIMSGNKRPRELRRVLIT